MPKRLMVIALAMLAAVSAGPSKAQESSVPDYFQYRVGIFRPTWRTEWLLHRVTLNGDTLGDRMLASDLQRLMMKTELPDTQQVDLTIWAVRISTDRHGRTTSITVIPEPNIDHLGMLHLRFINDPRRPRPAPLPPAYRQARPSQPTAVTH